jgi:integrase
MSVRIIPARGKRGGWEYDIRFVWPEGGRLRERGKCPLAGKDPARRWAEARERAIFAAGKAAHRAPVGTSAEVPTLAEFWPKVLSNHYQANRKKASTIKGAEEIYNLHLGPRFGGTRLDRISTSDVQALKGALTARSPKTVNNVLSVLSRALRCAVEWDIIASVPCRFGLLKAVTRDMEWYEPAEYRRLVKGAAKVDWRVHLAILLGGSAGLRRGEILALRWGDVDLERKQLHVQNALWYKHESTPKGNRGRLVPLTDELVTALRANRHLGERVLFADTGPLTRTVLQTWLRRARRAAGMPDSGRVHILRHTFCSHLALAGASAKAIQELAGHAELSTTMKYMHLSPMTRAGAVAELKKLYEEAV